MVKKQQVERTTVPIEGLKERIETCRSDSAWKALAISQKCRILIEERLDEIAPEPHQIVELERDQLNQITEFLKLLMGTRKRNGISLVEVASLLGIEVEDLNALQKYVRDCRQSEEKVK
ncbi:MAG: hypothetical protein F6K30_06640 [Cyanothece sp. SIO2G6]|nr:hypothetical protein [Cyanothece sp. SIO2G6]